MVMRALAIAIAAATASDKRPTPRMSAEETLGAQFGIGVDDTDAADVQLAGEIAAGRQASAGGQRAAFNLNPNVTDELTVNRLLAITVKHNREVDRIQHVCTPGESVGLQA